MNHNEPDSTLKKDSERRFYVAFIETLGVLILATMLGFMIYGGLKIAREAKTVGGKVSSFNTQVKQINTNLKSIDNKLQASKVAVP